MSAFPFSIAKRGARTALPLAALVVGGDMAAANKPDPVLAGEAEVGAIANDQTLSIDCADTSKPMTISIQTIEEWTDRLENRFLELAKKEALSKASDAELAELEQLEHQRNRLKCPMTFDELIWQAQHEEATQKLLSSMQDYLAFCAGPRWKGETRNR